MRGSGASTVEGGGAGAADSHSRKRARVRILGQEERQRGGPGARQSEADERRVDRLIADVGVAAEPVLDLEALREQADDSTPHRHLAHRVELRLVLQAPDQDLEPLAERLVTEGVEAGLVARLGHQVVVLRHVPPHADAGPTMKLRQ